MIESRTYSKRRRELAKAVQVDCIILTGSDQIQKSSDEVYSFAQDGYFYYLTGITDPGWLLVIDVVKGDEFLVAPDDSAYRNAVWDLLPKAEEITGCSGVKTIVSSRDGWGKIRRELNHYQTIGTHVIETHYNETFGMYLNPAKVSLTRKLRDIHPNANLVDVGSALRTLRTVKDDDEIAAIRQAIDLTRTGLELVGKQLEQYATEAHILADLSQHFLAANSDFAYPPIIAAGQNAAIVHYRRNNAPIVAGDMVLFDVGAVSDMYCADISRTYAVGETTQRQKDVWQAVADARAALLEQLKPGITLREFEAEAERLLGAALQDLGVTDNLLSKTIRQYYPHAISHHLGIDVHDSCDHDMPLPAGAVITVEPGLYLPEESIGVRIEDNILITTTGFENLSSDIPLFNGK